MIAIWQPEIVDQFQNADPSFANPPSCLKDMLTKNTTTVREMREELRGKSETEQIWELQQFLLAPLKDPGLVGQYSNMHDYCVYVNGYRHPESIRLAYMYAPITTIR